MTTIASSARSRKRPPAAVGAAVLALALALVSAGWLVAPRGSDDERVSVTAEQGAGGALNELGATDGGGGASGIVGTRAEGMTVYIVGSEEERRAWQSGRAGHDALREANGLAPEAAVVRVARSASEMAGIAEWVAGIRWGLDTRVTVIDLRDAATAGTGGL